jgi:hypothetical protein
MMDFINKNRTLILSSASALSGFVVIMLSAFVKTPLTPEQTKAVEAGCTALCGGLIYLENYLQNREHKANKADITVNATKIEGGK